MDRRQALKRLGAGAAVTAATTAIVSAPAFAVVPTITGSLTFSTVLVTGNTVTIRAAARPAGSCAASVPTSATFGNYRFTVTGTNGSSVTATGTGGTQVDATTVGGSGWNSGSSITVTFSQSYTCTVGGVTEHACATWTATIPNTGGNGSNAVFATTTVSPTVAPGLCP